jgi:hypothetical protein
MTHPYNVQCNLDLFCVGLLSKPLPHYTMGRAGRFQCSNLLGLLGVIHLPLDKRQFKGINS